MISDLFLGAFAFYFFWINRKLSKSWSFYFLFMSFSAIIGGIYHGPFGLAEFFRFLSWSMLSISLFFALYAVYKNRASKYLIAFFVIKGPVLLFLSIYYVSFNFLVVDTAISLLGFIVIGNLVYLKSLSKWISFGILASIPSVAFIMGKVIIDPEYMTYNDIGHYLSIFSLMLMSRGIREDAGVVKKGKGNIFD